jgi:hypothetical protein
MASLLFQVIITLNWPSIIIQINWDVYLMDQPFNRTNLRKLKIQEVRIGGLSGRMAVLGDGQGDHHDIPLQQEQE